MSTERLAPDVLIVQTNLTGTVSEIQDDPDSPDANWLDYVANNVNTVCRVSFPTPAGNPTEGAGVQNFRVLVRKNPGTGTPTAYVALYENGVLKRAGSAVNVTGPQIIAFPWNANEIDNADGSLVECYVYGTAVGGAPAGRCTVETGAIEWNCDYSEGATPKTVDGALPAQAGFLSVKIGKGASGVIPAPAGEVDIKTSRAQTGTLPAIVGSLGIKVSKSLKGILPSPTGAISGSLTTSKSTEGILPAPDGVLELLTKNQPGGILLTPIGNLGIKVNKTLIGVFPASSGSLERKIKVNFNGVLPSPTGLLIASLLSEPISSDLTKINNFSDKEMIFQRRQGNTISNIPSVIKKLVIQRR